MKIGIILNSNEPETVWNALRFGTEALDKNHNTKIFLLGRGVEMEDIDDEKYHVKKQVDFFIENKGRILACGTCLKSRQKKESNICTISSMMELLELVEESDKLLTFG